MFRPSFCLVNFQFVSQSVFYFCSLCSGPPPSPPPVRVFLAYSPPTISRQHTSCASAVYSTLCFNSVIPSTSSSEHVLPFFPIIIIPFNCLSLYFGQLLSYHDRFFNTNMTGIWTEISKSAEHQLYLVNFRHKTHVERTKNDDKGNAWL